MNFEMDIAQMGDTYIFLAIDRYSLAIYVQAMKAQDTKSVILFIIALKTKFPKIKTICTDGFSVFKNIHKEKVPG